MRVCVCIIFKILVGCAISRTCLFYFSDFIFKQSEILTIEINTSFFSQYYPFQKVASCPSILLAHFHPLCK